VLQDEEKMKEGTEGNQPGGVPFTKSKIPEDEMLEGEGPKGGCEMRESGPPH